MHDSPVHTVLVPKNKRKRKNKTKTDKTQIQDREEDQEEQEQSQKQQDEQGSRGKSNGAQEGLLRNTDVAHDLHPRHHEHVSEAKEVQREEHDDDDHAFDHEDDNDIMETKRRDEKGSNSEEHQSSLLSSSPSSSSSSSSSYSFFSFDRTYYQFWIDDVLDADLFNLFATAIPLVRKLLSDPCRLMFVLLLLLLWSCLASSFVLSFGWMVYWMRRSRSSAAI